MDFGVDIIYIINLPSYTERRNRLVELFRVFDITNYEFIEGIDGSDLSNQTTLISNGTLSKVFKDPNGLLTPSIIGCALSHRKAYETFLESKYQNCLILEDDAVFTSKMYTYLATGKFDLLVEQISKIKYDVFLWGRMFDNELGTTYTSLSEIYKPILNKGIYSAHAYQITRSSAEKLLNNCLPIQYAADVYLESLGLNFYSPEFNLITQKRGTIDHDSMEKIHNQLFKMNTSEEWICSTTRSINKVDDTPFLLQNCNIAPQFNIKKVVFQKYKSYIGKNWAFIHLKG